MKVYKILYYIATALMSLIFLFSAHMYLTKYDMVTGFFEHLGFPIWMIYPLAILKILGVIAVWVKKPKFLVEWAYAGFFFDAVAAYFAHGITDGQWTSLALIAVIATILSRVLLEKIK